MYYYTLLLHYNILIQFSKFLLHVLTIFTIALNHTVVYCKYLSPSPSRDLRESFDFRAKKSYIHTHTVNNRKKYRVVLFFFVGVELILQIIPCLCV